MAGLARCYGPVLHPQGGTLLTREQEYHASIDSV